MKSLNLIQSIKMGNEQSDKNGMHVEIRASGKVKIWYQNGKLHREDRDDNGRVLPAIEDANGDKYWYKNNNLHREDRDDNGRVLPAIESTNGYKEWRLNGKRHRDDKDENGRVLPAIEYPSRSKYWYKNNNLHREDIDENGNLLPAIEDVNGYKEWWIDGVKIKSPVIINSTKIKHIPYSISSHLPKEIRECSICLEIIDVKECYCSKECLHLYHRDCLNRNQNKCGVCER